MFDFFITIFGLVLTVVPFVLVGSYFLRRVSKKTKFDCHIRKVKDNKGNIGVLVAYLTKFFMFLTILLLGILCVYKFNDVFIMKLFLFILVSYFICNFFDKCNEN